MGFTGSNSPVGNGDAVTGTITANAQTVVADVRNFGAATLSVYGTFSTVNVTFEASNDGGANWSTLQVLRSSSNTLETTSGALSATPAYLWKANVAGLTHIRVRATAFTSGTQNWTITPAYMPSEPIVTVGGSVTATVSGTATVTPFTPTVYTLETAASTNAGNIKASAGAIFGMVISNPTATATFVKLYQKATAPTVGTDTPTVTISAPAGSTTVFNPGPVGLRFGTGIGIAVTAAAVKTDTAVAVAGVQIHAAYL